MQVSGTEIHVVKTDFGKKKHMANKKNLFFLNDSCVHSFSKWPFKNLAETASKMDFHETWCFINSKWKKSSHISTPGTDLYSFADRGANLGNVLHGKWHKDGEWPPEGINQPNGGEDPVCLHFTTWPRQHNVGEHHQKNHFGGNIAGDLADGLATSSHSVLPNLMTGEVGKGRIECQYF